MSSEQELGNEVLFRDGELIVSSARIEQDGFSCAAKYISTVNYSHDNPSSSHAWIGLFACAVAILTSMLYLYLGKLGVSIYVVLHLVVLTIAVMIVYLYLLSPMTYSIDVSLVNGQSFRIRRGSEKGIKEILAAVKEAVARNRSDTETANWASPTNPGAISEAISGANPEAISGSIPETIAGVNSAAPVNVAPFLNQAPTTLRDPVVRKTLPFSAGR